LNLLTVLSAACILAACATTNTDSQDAASEEAGSPTQVEPERAEVIEPQEDQAETLQIETQTEIEPMPTPLEAELASESVGEEAVQTEAVEEMAVFPEQSYEIEEPLGFESDSDAEIDRLRDELAASEAELERSRASETEAERSRALEAELERSRALEAELERSLAIEADAEQSRALEAERVRSRELEAELERSRAQAAEAERNRTLEAELERSRAQEAEAESERALAADLERRLAREAEAEAEFENSLNGGPDTDFDAELSSSTFADSDEMETASDEQDSGVPDYTAMAQASEDPESDAAGSRSFPPGKPVEYSIYFGYNQASLELEFETTLMKHAEYLKANPDLRVELQGNCDERGSREFNIALGSRRALTVKRALELLGIDGNRVEVVSFGSEKPVAFGHDEESWRLNRRADIVY
jgi:peptidoglycan-associated lipoprotein